MTTAGAGRSRTAGDKPPPYTPGDELPPLTVGELTRPQIAEYVRVARDPNPMHTDEELARAAGYPTVFAPGMLGMGLLSRYLVGICGVGNLRRIKVRFAKLAWPGEILRCAARVTAVESLGGKLRVDCDVRTENEHGEAKVVGSATFEVADV